MLYQRKSDFLICLDSDGAVMDTMTTKHSKCFGPVFIDVFLIPDHKQEIIDEWDRINIYSKSRGCNRFQALEMILEFVAQNYGYTYRGFDEFSYWVSTTKEFSIDALKAYRKTIKVSAVVDAALIWADFANQCIAKFPVGKPFKYVSDIVNTYCDKVDFVAVSSGNKAAIEREWKAAGFYDKCRFIACQEDGRKEKIFEELLSLGYSKDQVLMAGDALCDAKASSKTGIHFYPITPKREESSWKRFSDEGIVKFLNGAYDDDYENALLEEYYNSFEE